jgi:hypothetical protein
MSAEAVAAGAGKRRHPRRQAHERQKQVSKYGGVAKLAGSISSVTERASDDDGAGLQLGRGRGGAGARGGGVLKANVPAREPPPPPEPFLVHFSCCRAITAGDDDAPADCRTPKPTPRLVHWR